jgi:hypothetical protein
LRRLYKAGLKREFSLSARFHWSQRCAGHNTASRLARPRSSISRAIIAASIVLPTPTSSAISSRTGDCRSDMISGTN